MRRVPAAMRVLCALCFSCHEKFRAMSRKCLCVKHLLTVAAMEPGR
jgi:hypothetical protein